MRSFFSYCDSLLFTAGNEIAGHTLTHANLKHLKYADAHYQVCQDRDNLLAHNFLPTSFAYRFLFLQRALVLRHTFSYTVVAALESHTTSEG
jgi:hypothetical protein